MSDWHAFHPPERPPVPRRNARTILARQERWVRVTVAARLRRAARWLDPHWAITRTGEGRYEVASSEQRAPLPDGTAAGDRHDWTRNRGC